jgi:uncharacterized protein (TIGR02147 family)
MGAKWERWGERGCAGGKLSVYSAVHNVGGFSSEKVQIAQNSGDILKTDVFGYMDYRAFLKAAYAELKESKPYFSYRWFSKKAGVGSPSHLKLVINAERNLSPKTARAFAGALGITSSETDFFLCLVAMNQSKTLEERAREFEKLSFLAGFRETETIDRRQYDYYRLWYCIPIRELVARSDFREDPEWIADQMRPRILPEQAAAALELIEELGLIKRCQDGTLRHDKSLVSTGPELNLLALRQFHQKMLTLSREALDSIPIAEREIGGVTLRLTKRQFCALRERMRDLRKEILQLDGKEDGSQAVYQVSFQIIPISRFSEDSL